MTPIRSVGGGQRRGSRTRPRYTLASTGPCLCVRARAHASVIKLGWVSSCVTRNGN